MTFKWLCIKFSFQIRHAWVLPHCLSTTNYVEAVEFDAGLYNGGIILPGKVLPSDLGTVLNFDSSLHIE